MSLHPPGNSRRKAISTSMAAKGLSSSRRSHWALGGLHRGFQQRAHFHPRRAVAQGLRLADEVGQVLVEPRLHGGGVEGGAGAGGGA
ncbi:hypothetical protein [Deinococcus sedimenti]|uniref:hypothetical protein n=1 Tax=Deinococcus sedimenti TaxID=1867090 RepID=UPI00166A704B|nr:hypothetical protein [Deinococcus sedimenti]